MIDGRNFPDDLRHRGDHNFMMDDIELGFRVAYALEDESIGFGPLFDVQATVYFAKENSRATGKENN